MTFEETLEFMRHHPWNFYYVDPAPEDINPGSDYVCMGGGTSPRPQKEYRLRRERIDEIGSMINIMEIPSGWVGIGQYNFEHTDFMVRELLEGYPDRYFVPRVHLEPPFDWMRRYPEELCVYWKGPETPEEIRAMVGTPQQDLMGWDGDKKPYPDQRIARQSFSSPQWLRDAGEAFGALIDHLESGPYGRQILGYMPMFGNCGECMWWGDWRNQGDPRKGDFGIRHRELFFKWAVEKYGSLEALREAWNMPGLTAENLPMPTPPERWSENGKDLRGVLLADDQRQVDCNEFHSKCCFDAIEAFCKVVKDKTGKPAGGFYGYFQDETVGYAGHLAIERALSTPYVDFYSSPKAYHYCRAGDPGASQAPGQSFARRKMWIEENDLRSHHSEDRTRAPKTPGETRTTFWRELYRALTLKQGFWWMDIGGISDDWYTDGDMTAMFRQQADFYKRWSPIARKPAAEILFVEDEESCGHTTYISGPQRNLRLRLECELRLCGAPVDHFRVNDMLSMDLSRYKFIVFCHAFVMPEEKWRRLKERIRPDAHILWNYAAGILSPDFDPENQKRVTGFYTAECPGRMQPEELYRHIYWHCTHNCPQDYPLLEILPEAGQEVLQTSPDKKILTARIRRGGGASIFAADFTLRAPFIRGLLEEAGVRSYAPGSCAVLADEKLIGFFPRYDVKFTHSFEGLWRDVISGEEVRGPKTLEIRGKDFRIFAREEA